MRMLRLPGTALLAVLLLTAPVRSDAPSEKRIPLRLRGRNNTQRLQNREQYLGYLRSMLKPAEPATAPASGEKTVAADVARDAYVNARRLCPTDPRLETAVGIALIRAGERTEAMQRLSMAMKSRTTLYPPGDRVIPVPPGGGGQAWRCAIGRDRLCPAVGPAARSVSGGGRTGACCRVARADDGLSAQGAGDDP